MIKYISFDLDGTLADDNFDHLLWNEEIPKLYAKQHRLSLETAKEKVYAAYFHSLYIEKINNWTDLGYWFKRFELKDWQKLLHDMKEHVLLYDDTIEILQYLTKKYQLIIVSNAEEKTLNLKVDSEGIRKHFAHIFSAPSTFSISRKNKEMFHAILKKLRIKPSEMVHVGDDHHLDYEVPSSLGIKSYHLVRSKKRKGEHVIHSLLDLKRIL